MTLSHQGKGGGDSSLDRLLRLLTPEQREQVQRLSLELGIRPDDRLFLLLIVLQYYLLLLQDIPNKMDDASQQSLDQITTHSNSIETQIKTLVAKLQSEKTAITDAIKESYSQIKTTSEAQSRATASKVNEELHKQQVDAWQTARKTYIDDLDRQTFWKSLAYGLAGIMVCVALAGGLGYKLGWEGNQQQWDQSFGGAATFDWFTGLWFTKDNQKRLRQCHKTEEQRIGEDKNKCTIWYQ
ncbi:hypothetical protein NDI45_20310 [Leptolyngbya sp. GB1-A1]|uniref:hypothetical protein n=1 Tax=Leptolyngbya sp. GB1-A1 TaxID=2933908 RepID=UPI0032999D21